MAEKIIDGVTFKIHSEMDVLMSRRQAVQMAQVLKFSDIAQAEVEIAVSELGTNIVKHAGARGVLSVAPCEDSAQKIQGIKITARNLVPSGDRAALDNSGLMRVGGVSTTGTLGIGVSGVRRLMDEFRVETDHHGCLVITALKWPARVDGDRAGCSVMARPCPGESQSGDAYYVRHLHRRLLFGVIDGLGHGPEAHAAALIAVKTIDLYRHEPLENIMRRCHMALKGSRGAAMSLGLLDHSTRLLQHLGVGNVETRIYVGDKIVRPMLFNGTLGVVQPHLRVAVHPFARGMILAMYSDGISDKFEIDGPLRRRSPQEISHYILTHFSRPRDDSTVLVIK
jgi:anti-sigma regulatory factor (Ser/Thr protein kinase)